MNKCQAKLVSQFKVLMLCVLFSTATFAKELQAYLFTDIAFNNAAYSKIHDQFLGFVNNDEFERANQLMLELGPQVSKDKTIDKMSFAMTLTNSAVSNALVGKLSPAILDLDAAIQLGEQSGRYHLKLVNILMVRSLVSQLKGEQKEAENALRRSQHIFHRNDGVYAEAQLEVIEALTDMHLKNGNAQAADREQFFRLKVNEEVYGSNSEKIIPALESLGLYFANRASSIANLREPENVLYRDKLFKEAINLFERSLAIIEDKYDANDLRLVRPLKGLSKTRFMQGSSFTDAKETMERASSIISNNPTTDIPDHAKSLVALGDTYLVTQDVRSAQTYSQAWALLGEVPENEFLRETIFGQPKLLYPEVLIRPILNRQPSNTVPEDDLYVNLEYDVRHDGKVRNIKIIDGNVPNNQKKLLRDYVSQMRFRPRFVDGEAATTQGMKLHQSFSVVAYKATAIRTNNNTLSGEQTLPNRNVDTLDQQTN
ncbi:MAG: tetratricopeptide (TPR) repeat protein [Candidatus Azotimanducaceae bacterium]|jgi:tetratricopeptide (TPR) repeat protein